MAKRDSTRNGSVRVVLYLRMSSAGQDQSIPAQRAELRAYAKKLGYEIVGEYLDEAISGDDTERRAGFLRMREDAQRGTFDAILSWDQDRFGRFDQLDAGYWIYPFRRAGVRLETIAQGPIDWEDLTGQLVYSVNQMGKAQFLRDLARNTARGQLNSAREGRARTATNRKTARCGSSLRRPRSSGGSLESTSSREPRSEGLRLNSTGERPHLPVAKSGEPRRFVRSSCDESIPGRSCTASETPASISRLETVK